MKTAGLKRLWTSRLLWRKFAQTVLPALFLLVVFTVTLFFYIIPQTRTQYIAQREIQIKNLSEVALSVIDSQNHLVLEGKKDINTAQKTALERIRQIKYGTESTGYFWVQNNESIVISHPISEIENKTPDNVDPKYSEALRKVMKMTDHIVADKKNQSIIYDWYNDTTGSYGKKMSYLSYYEPWGWIIGNGVFIDDIQSEIDRLLSDIILVGIILSVASFILSLLFSMAIVRSRIDAEKTESALADSIVKIKTKEEQFETIFNISPISIVLIRISDDVILKANPEFEKLSGLSSSEITGKSSREILLAMPDEYERLKKNFMSANSLMCGIDKINFQMTLKSGVRKDLVYSIVPIIYDGEKCFVAMIFDITEEKALQEQLAQSQKMDTVGQLAGGIAHDFNNMLSGILGSAEVIGMIPDLNDEVREYINIIINAAERASELTSKLLAFSRRGKIVSSVIDIHECITSVIMLLKRSIDKRIVIKESLLSERFRITGDPTLIQNALLNLAINAKDAMPEGGTITISTRESYLDDNFLKKYPHADKGLYLEIDVSDTGTGISRENIPKIFDPFFTTKPVGKGTGLGLAAVYGTVKEHRGFIRVYSEENVGTVFRIFLPIDSERNFEKEKTESVIISGKGRILVVDDESVIRNTAYGMLSSMGYEVLLAQDGEEALMIYESEKEKIDLVILDMVMPKISGKETFERLKKIDKSVKVVFSSGFSPEAVAGDIRGKGAIGFIQKPYRIVELSRLIHEAITS